MGVNHKALLYKLKTIDVGGHVMPWDTISWIINWQEMWFVDGSFCELSLVKSSKFFNEFSLVKLGVVQVQGNVFG